MTTVEDGGHQVPGVLHGRVVERPARRPEHALSVDGVTKTTAALGIGTIVRDQITDVTGGFRIRYDLTATPGAFRRRGHARGPLHEVLRGDPGPGDRR